MNRGPQNVGKQKPKGTKIEGMTKTWGKQTKGKLPKESRE
jgi:hypothetical protein